MTEPMQKQDKQRLEEIISRNRVGQKPTAEEREWILQGINGYLGLDGMAATIARITKMIRGKRTVYTFEMSDGQCVEIAGIEYLRKQGYLLNRLSEILDVIVDLPEGVSRSSATWNAVVDAMLAVVEAVESVEHRQPAVINEAIVREWIRAYVHEAGIFEMALWDEAKQLKCPVFDGNQLWISPQRIAELHALKGNALYRFYDVLRQMGIEPRSKKVGGKVCKAYAIEWHQFFKDENDLFAYGFEIPQVEAVEPCPDASGAVSKDTAQ